MVELEGGLCRRTSRGRPGGGGAIWHVNTAGCSWKDVARKGFLGVFRCEAIEITRNNREPREKIAANRGIAPATLPNRVKAAEIETRSRDGVTNNQAEECDSRFAVPARRSRKTRCCVVRQSIFRGRTWNWAPPQNDVLGCPQARRGGCPFDGDGSGVEDGFPTPLPLVRGSGA